MHRPPDLSAFPKYPVSAGTVLLAVGVSVANWTAKWTHLDVSRLYATVAIRQGEIWRLVTSTLPHVNVVHLLFNAYWTWVFGTLIEEVYGHFRTIAIFLLFAVVANGSEYALLDGGMGLSGVVYGLFGLLWVLSYRHAEFSGVIDRNTIILFVVWFFACIVTTVTGILPVGNIAHGMGAAIGALLGYTITARGLRRQLAVGATGVVLAAVLLGTTIARPWINLASDRGVAEATLGYDALMADQNDEAALWFADAIRMQPKMGTYWLDYGISLERLKRPAEADAAFRRASELDPSILRYQAK